MASPTVVNQASTANAVGATHALTMPGSIVAGNLLITFVTANGASLTMSGWTPTFTPLSNTTNTLASFVKIAVGGDTGTLSMSGSANSAMITYQVSGWSGVVAGIGAVTSTATAFNPPNLNMVTSRDYLWFAVASGSGAPTYTAPTNYTNLQQQAASTGSKVGVAQRQLTASAEDPGAFGGSGISFQTNATVAIPPALAASVLPGQFLPFFGMGHHDEENDELAARRGVRRPTGLYVPRRRRFTVARAA